ncbi:uncharacterized protein LOC109607967 isoform X2 [Aethina tumida]|uniref:uncharacterized protein LOC109607967 isoform X2 n=1 Tax=Aethina tumida TaxID=116153 RepID=UPI002148A062|nr:uncharacterized protein LOC109607967 isoform X2 [Aethina tumida]
MMPEILSGVHADFKPVSPKTRRALSKNRHQYVMKSNLNLNVVNNDDMKRTNSFVVGQKLRESKWFPHEETGVFCAVVESGFIVEVKNETEETHSGVVLWTAGFEKSKNPDHIQIYTVQDVKGKQKVVASTLHEFWPPDTKIRINNKTDKSESPLNEDTIRNQIIYGLNAKRKWHNSEHFTYFCRYGPIESRKIMDFKWNPGSFFQKIKSLSIK